MHAIFKLLICISFSYHKGPNMSKNVSQKIRGILINFHLHKIFHKPHIKCQRAARGSRAAVWPPLLYVRCLAVLVWTYLLPEQTRSLLCVCLRFQILWHGCKMLFSNYLSRFLCVSPLHSTKTCFVENDAFDRSPLGPGSSPLASEGVVCRPTVTFGGKTSQEPLAVESSDPTTHQEVNKGLETLLLHIWKLSSNLCARLAFQKRLQKLSPQT